MGVLVTTLKELLLNSESRPRVISDAVALVESEVQAKGGVSGMAIKAGYAAVNKLKPTLIQEAVDSLIDQFIEKLEPFFSDWKEKGQAQNFDSFLNAQKNAVANALLEVTDERANQTQSGVIKKTYERLRPLGEKNVEAAVPGLGQTLNKLLN
ncbi:MAG: hypothetical protein KTR25_17580 [Myxococcales bacterium]|nr:hypothetical protein [Myxococcales bacterium]